MRPGHPTVPHPRRKPHEVTGRGLQEAQTHSGRDRGTRGGVAGGNRTPGEVGETTNLVCRDAPDTSAWVERVVRLARGTAEVGGTGIPAARVLQRPPAPPTAPRTF